MIQSGTIESMRSGLNRMTRTSASWLIAGALCAPLMAQVPTTPPAQPATGQPAAPVNVAPAVTRFTAQARALGFAEDSYAPLLRAIADPVSAADLWVRFVAGIERRLGIGAPPGGGVPVAPTSAGATVFSAAN